MAQARGDDVAAQFVDLHLGSTHGTRQEKEDCGSHVLHNDLVGGNARL
jgi:hypothetical protein